jgi:DNA/RNA endonuclease YhcR with UshA esterase domain
MNTLLRLIAAVLLLSLCIPSPSRADAPTITDSEAAQHIGQNVIVEGVVTVVSTSRKGNRFINFGDKYPNQTFTGWIPAGTALATDDSIPALQGKKIRITGRIELYRGKPEIKIMSKDQLVSE